MLMHRIKLENLLSFGPNVQELELGPLNVLIGPNGSGKSNLIEAISLLRAAPNDITAPIREGGGGDHWVWRGEAYPGESRVEAVLETDIFDFLRPPLRYSLTFGPFHYGMMSFREEITEFEPIGSRTGNVERYLDRSIDRVTLRYRDESVGTVQQPMDPNLIRSDQSILSQIRDPFHYPEITSMGTALAGIHLYRSWFYGRSTPQRLPQRADLPNHTLMEDGRNLGMILNRLESDSQSKNRLLVALRRLYDGIDDFYVQVEAGSIQVFLREGSLPVPATRLSDGTLRYLCLLAILCDPSPPPLVCIEEPELGLHPDILPGLADLFREASERCQLIVTTHSDTFVDALTETPESIIICEKEEQQTRLRRLERKDLSHWLEKYRLGELWTSGELGGNRW